MKRKNLLVWSFMVVSALTAVSEAFCAERRPSGTLISRSFHDINSDGRKERIDIVLDRGRLYRDREQWCGAGEKWEGSFSMRIYAGHKLLADRPLNALFPGGSNSSGIFFWTPAFTLVFQDYNGDGQPDFNLGQYGNCNGNLYQLFTIRKDGTVSELEVDGSRGLFVSPPGKINSTPLIRAATGGISYSYYDNTEAREKTIRLHWDGTRFVNLSLVEEKKK